MQDYFSLTHYSSLRSEEVWWREPVLQGLVVSECVKVLGWRLQGLNPLDRFDWPEIIDLALSELDEGEESSIVSHGIAALKKELGGYNSAQGPSLQNLFEFAVFNEYSNAVPVCNLRTSRMLIDRMTRSLVADAGFSCDLPAGAKFAVPSLSNASLADVARLRQNEETFHTFRSALLAVQEACLREESLIDWAAYHKYVREVSADILSPVIANIDRKLRKHRWATWALAASGSTALKLGIDAAAGLAGVPGANLLSGPVTAAVRSAAARRSNRAADLEIARALLVTLYDPDDPNPV